MRKNEDVGVLTNYVNIKGKRRVTVYRGIKGPAVYGRKGRKEESLRGLVLFDVSDHHPGYQPMYGTVGPPRENQRTTMDGSGPYRRNPRVDGTRVDLRSRHPDPQRC